MSNINTMTAQPVFSDDEMVALFRALGVKGDVHNEADCERAMTELNAALSDPEREQDVSAVLTGIATEAGEPDPLISEGPVTAIRLAPQPGGAAAFLDDEPSTGRILNWAEQRRLFPRAADRSARVGVSGGYTVLSGGNSAWRPDWKAPREKLASWEAFIARAGESLPGALTSRAAHLWKALLRPDEWFQRNEVRWRTVDDFVDLEVRHGERTWDVKLQISETAVLLLVVKDQQTVVEREVARSSPEDFSRTLLRALDGDVTSTHLTLDAVQQAASADPHALH